MLTRSAFAHPHSCVTIWLHFRGPHSAQGAIKIGDINSYKAMAANMGPLSQGNAIWRSRRSTRPAACWERSWRSCRATTAPIRAMRFEWRTNCVLKEQVDVLTGTILSHVGLAVADYAKQKKIFFLASAPLTDKIVWESGNRYTFRLRPSTYTHAAVMVPHAASSSSANVGPSSIRTTNTASRRSRPSRICSKMAQPDVEFVAELAPPLGKFDAGSVVEALADARPDAIFNVLFGADLAKFAARGQDAWSVQGRRGGQPAHGRARISRSAQG